MASCWQIVMSLSFLRFTKKSPTQPSHYCFEQRYYFLQKNADIGKIKGVLVLKGIFSETTPVCVLTYQTSNL